MLVLSRKNRQSVVVECSDGFERLLKVTVLAIRREKVILGFEVEDDVPVHRSKVKEPRRAGGQPGRPQRRGAAANEMNRWEDDGGGADRPTGHLVTPQTAICLAFHHR